MTRTELCRSLGILLSASLFLHIFFSTTHTHLCSLYFSCSHPEVYSKHVFNPLYTKVWEKAISKLPCQEPEPSTKLLDRHTSLLTIGERGWLRLSCSVIRESQPPEPEFDMIRQFRYEPIRDRAALVELARTNDLTIEHVEENYPYPKNNSSDGEQVTVAYFLDPAGNRLF